NGAGKTTTMRILAGVETPDAGEALLEGVSIIDNPGACRRRIGFMPDYLDSYPRLLVSEYLDFYSRIYGQRPPVRRRRLEDVVGFTGLADMLDRPVEGLSRGWKQRLSLARVMVNDPAALILDEPAAGLDPRARVELRDLVLQLADRGKAVFISSHIIGDLSEMCTSVTIIENGRVRATGDLDEVRRRADRGRRVAVKLLGTDFGNVPRLARRLAEAPGVFDIREQRDGAVFTHDGDDAFRADILAGLVADGFRVTDFCGAAASLEDAFIVMTGDGKE
ncbi:MAG: ABC transporter ATP-binding protein, partial [Planctomycetota bacterium]|nr:ABC transporter ATP-binding protein [Planctomycetota bacterium]